MLQLAKNQMATTYITGACVASIAYLRSTDLSYRYGGIFTEQCHRNFSTLALLHFLPGIYKRTSVE